MGNWKTTSIVETMIRKAQGRIARCFFPLLFHPTDKRNPTSLFVFEVSSFITKYRPVFSCHPRILDILLSARYSPFNKPLHTFFSCWIRQCKIARSNISTRISTFFVTFLYIRNRWVECIVISDEDRVYQSRRSIKFGRFVNELTDYRYVHTGIFVRIIDTVKSTTVPMTFEKLSIIWTDVTDVKKDRTRIYLISL